MKTPETLKDALVRYQDELAQVREKLKEVDNVWVRSGNIMANTEFIVACVEQAKELRRLEYEADFRVRFIKWVLE